jgi:putative spermidine/putrescine transport system permease protein
LRSISPDLEMAARGMGARPSVVFMRVTLPLSLPGAVAGSVLVFVLALGFYLTPEMLGGGTQSYIGQAIVTWVEQLLQTGVGEAMSGLLLAMVLVVLALAARFSGIGKILGIGRGSGQ